MMKINTVLFIAAGIAVSGCAHDPSVRAVRTQCRLEMEAARTAVQLREQGKSKQAILQSLPPLHADSTRLLRQMYQFVDDTFAFPELNDSVYGIYRFEYCVRQLQHRAVPRQLQEVSRQLLACQTQLDNQTPANAVSCVRRSFPAQPDKQQQAGTDKLSPG